MAESKLVYANVKVAENAVDSYKKMEADVVSR